MSNEVQLAQRIDRVAADLNSSAGGARRGAILVFLFCLILGGLFAFYVVQVNSILMPMTEPKTLVQTISGVVDADKQVPDMVKQLETTVVKESPAWAKTLATDAVKQIPEARKSAQKLLTEQFDTGIKEAKEKIKDKFREFAKKHKTEISKAIKDMAAGPEQAKKATEEVLALYEKESGINLKETGKEMMATLFVTEEHFKRLSEGKKLSKFEALLGETISILKALAISKAGALQPDGILKDAIKPAG
jgi:hypothetical protein